MTEWWTYRLSDFLMFSPRTYWRLVELYNRELWPAQAALVLAAAIAVLCAWREKFSRVVLAALAAAWLWTAWAFLWQRYADINWGARYLAAAFALQALLLAAAAAQRLGQIGASRPAGLVLAALGLAYPATAWLWGRPLVQAETPGLMPDPTALLTLGLLLMMPVGRWTRRGLLVIPAFTLAAGAATHWAMAG